MMRQECFDDVAGVLMVFELTPETALSMSTPTRRVDINKGAELQRLATKAAAETMRRAELGMRALARQFGLDTERCAVHFDGFRVETQLQGICDESAWEIADQLAGTAALLREIERRISAVLARDVRIAFANPNRVELVENPAYCF